MWSVSFNQPSDLHIISLVLDHLHFKGRQGSVCCAPSSVVPRSMCRSANDHVNLLGGFAGQHFGYHGDAKVRRENWLA